jgi:hypothetical protein
VASRHELTSKSVGAFKGPFLITWTLFPDWTEALAPAPKSDIGQALPYGSLALAHGVLDLLAGLREYRDDLHQLYSLYPQLGDLLVGRRRLPELPGDPPAAFMRIRGAARGPNRGDGM